MERPGVLSKPWPKERLFHSFFVIYRLGFLSDLEHRVWNTPEEIEDPKP